MEASFEQEAREDRVLLVTENDQVAADWCKADLKYLQVTHPADDEFVEHRWTRGSDQGTLGYFGTVRKEEIDIEKMVRLAQVHRLEIVGPVDDSAVEPLLRAGATLHDLQPLDELVKIMDTWDAIVLPYREGPRTETLVPAKIWNALATGKPVYYTGLALPASVTDMLKPLDELLEGAKPECELSADRPIPTADDAWHHISHALQNMPPRHR
ncbi:hypothetical protein [Nesterenkonia alba]|uniref:hypothetical protein n=1 Tax=Nesterenkonia alba TaxID=515814 RepID=UPI0003B44F30|nr:hypothetical protein [Nesterenkonia alba]